VQTTHLPNDISGFLTITHPYHPRKGYAHEILKIKNVNNVRYCSLRAGEDVVCIPESFTNRAVCQPGQTAPLGTTLDVQHLAELVRLLKPLDYFSEEQ
jgi:hypothetical protein